MPEELVSVLSAMKEIQEYLGYLSEEAIVKVGSFLGLSTTKIYGLATFYDRFRFIPMGKIKISICNGTSCFLSGSRAIIDKTREETGILPGQTTRDGNFSYEIVSCMGAFRFAPDAPALRITIDTPTSDIQTCRGGWLAISLVLSALFKSVHQELSISGLLFVSPVKLIRKNGKVDTQTLDK